MKNLTLLEPEIVVELDRRCGRCGRLRPASHFKDSVNGPVFDACRQCRASQYPGKLTEYDPKVTDLAKRLAASARGNRIESPHVAELNAEMMRLFGGVEGFCRAWFDQIQIAIVERPGTKAVLDQFAELTKLAKVATENRDSAPDIATLTDEELGKEMLKLAMSVLPAITEEKA